MWDGFNKTFNNCFACSLNNQLILVNYSSTQVYFNFLLYIDRIILKVYVFIYSDTSTSTSSIYAVAAQQKAQGVGLSEAGSMTQDKPRIKMLAS